MLIHPPMLERLSLNPEHLLTEDHVCTGSECQCMPPLGKIITWDRRYDPAKDTEEARKQVSCNYSVLRVRAPLPSRSDPRCASLRDSLGHTPATYPSALLPSITAIICDRPAVGNDWCILCHQRSDNHHWGFPGGGQHIGESILETVKREVHEETGLDVSIQGLVCVDTDPTRGALCSYPDGNVVQYCNLTFLCILHAGILTQSSESLQLSWHPAHHLPGPFLATHRWRLQQALQWMQGKEVAVR